MQLPAGQGMWPAFWLLGNNSSTVGWPAVRRDRHHREQGAGAQHGARHRARPRLLGRQRHHRHGAHRLGRAAVGRLPRLRGRVVRQPDRLLRRRHHLLHDRRRSSCRRTRSGCSTIRSASSSTSRSAALYVGPPDATTTFPADAARRLRARLRAAAVSGARASLACVVVAGCSADAGAVASSSRDVLSVSVEQASAWTRNFNPLLVGAARWPTRGGIYEPLFIWNSAAGAWVPWLATAYRWSADHRTLTVTTARRRHAGPTARRSPRRTSPSPSSCSITSARSMPAASGTSSPPCAPSTRAPSSSASRARSCPASSSWCSRRSCPRTSGAPSPIRSRSPTRTPSAPAPSPRCASFATRSGSWARTRATGSRASPQLDALRMIAYPTNDQANLALVEGEIDWAGNFVPAIDRTFVARDRAHHGYWYPTTGSTVFLYPNTARAPLDDVRVRKALSLAIDRQRVVDIGLYGYARPSDGTGPVRRLRRAGAIPPSPPTAGCATTRAPRARCSTKPAGAADSDGVRKKDGRRLAVTLEVVSGWSDWVRAAQVIARDLGEVGVDVSLRAYEWSAWFQRLQSGEFELAIACPSLALSFEAPTPYYVYRWISSSTSATRPLGELLPTNWNRFGDARTDALLAEFERTDDAAQQHALMQQVEARFAATAPAIPLFSSPPWGVFSSRRFVGFPSATDPYADAVAARRAARICSCSRTCDRGRADALRPAPPRALRRRRLGRGHARLRAAAPHARRSGDGAVGAPARQALAGGARLDARRARLRRRLAAAPVRDLLAPSVARRSRPQRRLLPGSRRGGHRHRAFCGRSRSPAAPSSSASSPARCSASLAAWRRGGWLDSMRAAGAGAARRRSLLLAGDGRAVRLRLLAALVPARPRLQPRSRARRGARASSSTSCATPRCRR